MFHHCITSFRWAVIPHLIQFAFRSSASVKEQKDIRYIYHMYTRCLVTSLVFHELGHCVFALHYYIQYLTIFNHSAVLLTLCLSVELVGVGLAETLFVGHTQTDGRVKGPYGWLTSAGLGCHGQTAHGWGDRAEQGYVHMFSRPLCRDRLYYLILAHGCALTVVFLCISGQSSVKGTHMNSPLTLSATSLQTHSLSCKVVLVPQTPSVLKHLTAHWGGVVIVTLVHPKTWSCLWCCSTGRYGRGCGWGDIRENSSICNSVCLYVSISGCVINHLSKLILYLFHRKELCHHQNPPLLQEPEKGPHLSSPSVSQPQTLSQRYKVIWTQDVSNTI